MKNSEIIALAWSMHRGQPNENRTEGNKLRVYIGKDYLCNLISSVQGVTIDEVFAVKDIIRGSLPCTAKCATYTSLFLKQNPQYVSEDWEFYKHSEFYLTEKGKWVQSLIDQCKKEENYVDYTLTETDFFNDDVRIATIKG